MENIKKFTRFLFTIGGELLLLLPQEMRKNVERIKIWKKYKKLAEGKTHGVSIFHRARKCQCLTIQ
jgi:hypothetical protein